MKMILYLWGSNSEGLLRKKLIESGHDVINFVQKCLHYTRDMDLAQGLLSIIHSSNAEAVISYNYFPIISMVCNAAGIYYYSWVYDSPHYTLFAKSVNYACNRIGVFDRAMARYLSDMGIETVEHLPLGVEWKAVPINTKYQCDVSFVGSLYIDEYNYFNNISMPESVRDRSNKYLKRQEFVYDKDFLSEFFLDYNGNKDTELINSLKDSLDNSGLTLGEGYLEDIEYIFRSSVLEKKLTVDERRKLLNRVAGMNYDFRLYTGSDVSESPLLNRTNKGYVDYYEMMPLVFKNSKINLNITLRSIHSGIPLRALDIMGCGGFLLSNYQKELEEVFEEDVEIVMFRSVDECMDKIEYYLKHEDERTIIAENGRQAVSRKLGYLDQLSRMLEL